jgi:hypothetical protein
MAKCANHPHNEASTTCRVCKTECCIECSSTRLVMCHRCGTKVLIVLLIGMVVLSYSAWFGVL